MKISRTHIAAACCLAFATIQPALAKGDSPATINPASVSMKVIGKIKPASCNVQLNGSDTVDYGDIHPGWLKDEVSGNPLPNQNALQMAVICEARTTVGVSTTDDHKNTEVDNLDIHLAGLQTVQKSSAESFGLGISNGKKLGAYLVEFHDTQADGVVVGHGYVEKTFVNETDKAATVMYNRAGRAVTWAAKDAKTPLVGQQFHANLTVNATLDRAGALDLSKENKLDGGLTLSVVYL